MKSKECIAMILAGGQGSRLGALTKNIAKPAVPFGGKYRIIDFPLSNCTHSGIDTVGVLTQYQPLELNTYIGNGQPWDLDRKDGGVYILPPYVTADKGEWYKGTANAIYQNIGFVNQFDPKYVVILSGDHIYKMDYSKMVDAHRNAGADATIAVIEVAWNESSRFGIMNTDNDMNILEFEEKPEAPKNNLASMGVYVFSWHVLKKYLILDENDSTSEKDFGKNIIPQMLNDRMKLLAYKFEGYWKDVGTIQSLWEANMEVLDDVSPLNIDSDWKIYSKNPTKPPHYIAPTAKVKDCYITEGCEISGLVTHSIIFEGVTIEEGAIVKDSIIFPGSFISKGAVIDKTIIGYSSAIYSNSYIGSEDRNSISEFYNSKICSNGITLIGNNVTIDKDIKIIRGSMIMRNVMKNTYLSKNDIGNTSNSKKTATA